MNTRRTATIHGWLLLLPAMALLALFTHWPAVATLIDSLYSTARRIAKSLGFDIPHKSAGGGSDGNFTGAMGIRTLDGLGVQGAGYHTLDEHILVDSLVQRGRLMAGLLATLS